MNKLSAVTLFGLPLFNGSLDQALSMIQNYENTVSDDRTPLVFTPNLDIVVQMKELRKARPELTAALSRSFMVLPDGFPIVWTARLCGTPVVGRVAGSDLFDRLMCCSHDKRVFLVAPDEDTAVGTKERFTAGCTGEMNTYVPMQFQLGTPGFDQEVSRIVARIETFQPDYVIVCLGFPKQETVALSVIQSMALSGDRPLFLAMGASAEFYAGTKKRAPRWMQQAFLEWLHRLVQEPGRLFLRYLFGAFRFVPLAYREILLKRARKGKSVGT